MEKFITQYDFADLLSVHVNTVRRWIQSGMPHLKIGSTIRIDAKEAMKWLEEKGK